MKYFSYLRDDKVNTSFKIYGKMTIKQIKTAKYK